MEPLLLVLTHDVDWGRWGPPLPHVLDRASRFGVEGVWRLLALRENLYGGLVDILEAEERQGLRSTIFLRPAYDDGTAVDLYSDLCSDAARRGWEVGLHANDASSVEGVAREREAVELACGAKVLSMRVHYLRLDPSILPRLPEAGILVDSSICRSREGPSLESAGYEVHGELLELPVTVMDAYMFSYWGVKPGKALEALVQTLKWLHESGARVATLLWHADGVRMRGGRAYLEFVERIWELEWLEPVTAAEARRRLLGASPKIERRAE